MIRVVCSSCGKGIKAPEHYAGKTVDCPQCGAPVQIASSNASILATNNEDAGVIDNLRVELNEAKYLLAAIQKRIDRLDEKLSEFAGSSEGFKVEPTGQIDRAVAENGDVFTIVSIDTRITESNDSWSRFAWILKVKNETNDVISLSGVVNFLDKDGFVVQTQSVYDLVIPGNSSKKVRDSELIDASIVRQVDGVSVELARDI